MKRVLAGLSVVALAVACAARADGPPEIVVDRTACSHCGMLVSEPIYAAAYQAPGAAGRVFDDIGCLLAAARQEREAALTFWFHDAADGRWMDGPTAVFVASPSIRTPMGGGIVAYRTRAGAEAAAARTGGAIVASIDELQATSGGAK
jgi:copper chaperone NosL